jgi:hypothetical protein
LKKLQTIKKNVSRIKSAINPSVPSYQQRDSSRHNGKNREANKAVEEAMQAKAQQEYDKVIAAETKEEDENVIPQRTLLSTYFPST